MHDLLKSALLQLTEPFFARVREYMSAAAEVAYRRAAAQHGGTPLFRQQLGDARYWERNAALQQLAEHTGIPGLRLDYGFHKGHRYPLIELPDWRILHGKIEQWDGPLEQKDYRLALAEHNPPGGRQLSLFGPGSPAHARLGLIVVQYHGSGSEDQSQPLRIGFGLPTAMLDGWVFLHTVEDLMQMQSDLGAAPPLDHARPRLRTEPGRKDASQDDNAADTGGQPS